MSNVSKRKCANQVCTLASAKRRKRSGMYAMEMDWAGEKTSEGNSEQDLQFLVPFESGGVISLAPNKRANTSHRTGYRSDALRKTQLTCASKKPRRPVWVSHYFLAWNIWGIFLIYTCPCQISFKTFLWWQHFRKFLINAFRSAASLINVNKRETKNAYIFDSLFMNQGEPMKLIIW